MLCWACAKEEQEEVADEDAAVVDSKPPPKRAVERVEEPPALAAPTSISWLEMLAKQSTELGRPTRLGALVHWQRLRPLIPRKLGNFSRDGGVHGATEGMASMPVARVKATFHHGNTRLWLQITDTSLAPIFRAGFTLARSISLNGKEQSWKSLSVNNAPAAVRWNKQNQRAQLTILAADRFLIDLSISPATSDAVLGPLVTSLDFAKLNQLARENRH